MPNKFSQFWQELKRRNVVRVITVYAGAAFVIIELINNITEPLRLPDWTPTLVIVLLAIGFPLVIIFSWIYDVRPEGGIVKTEPADKVKTEDIPKSSNGWKIASYISFVVIVAMTCILLYPKIFKKDKLSDVRNEEGVISLAVLPFDNLTGDSSLHYWQNGISEYLINRLANSQELAVSSSQVVLDVLGTTRQVNAASISPNIARETAVKIDASTYITGNFIGKETDARIMLNLVNTGNGKLIWSTSVSGDLSTDFQAVLDHLSDTVRNYMEIRALERNTETDFSNAYPHSAESYRHYIEGLNALVASNFDIAIESLLKAYELDTTFTLAAFYLAFAYEHSFTNNNKEIYKWTIRAHELRENLPSFYRPWIEQWYAGYITKDLVDIIRYNDLIYEADIPNRLLLFDIALTYYTYTDNYAKSIKALEKIEALNELWQDDWRYDRYYWRYARILLKADRPDDAERVITKGLGVSPEHRGLHLARGVIHIMNGDSAGIQASKEWIKEEARARGLGPETYEHNIGIMYLWAKESLTASGYFRKVWEMDPGRLESLYFLIYCQLESNVNIEECSRLADILLEKVPEYFESWAQKGISLYKLGRYDESLEYLKEASNKGRVPILHVVRYISLAEQALAQQAQSQE